MLKPSMSPNEGLYCYTFCIPGQYLKFLWHLSFLNRFMIFRGNIVDSILSIVTLDGNDNSHNLQLLSTYYDSLMGLSAF